MGSKPTSPNVSASFGSSPAASFAEANNNNNKKDTENKNNKE